MSVRTPLTHHRWFSSTCRRGYISCVRTAIRLCARVERVLMDGEACWCPMVRLELWNGASGEREQAILRDFERVLEDLPIDGAVWALAQILARETRSQRVTAPATSS